jgi:hypothetical protein
MKTGPRLSPVGSSTGAVANCFGPPSTETPFWGHLVCRGSYLILIIIAFLAYLFKDRGLLAWDVSAIMSSINLKTSCTSSVHCSFAQEFVNKYEVRFSALLHAPPGLRLEVL